MINLEAWTPIAKLKEEEPWLWYSSVARKDIVKVPSKEGVKKSDINYSQGSLYWRVNSVSVKGEKCTFLNDEKILILEASFGLHPVEVFSIKMGTYNVGNVSEYLTELEAWIEVEELGYNSYPGWHIKVEKYFFDCRGLC